MHKQYLIKRFLCNIVQVCSYGLLADKSIGCPAVVIFVIQLALINVAVSRKCRERTVYPTCSLLAVDCKKYT